MNALQKIRMGLLLANIKLGRVCTHDESYPKDPNPENWRTINGSKVHLTNGRIDGGASGKFKGKPWTGQKAHGSNSFFPRFNYQQNLFGGQEVMPSRTMQKETNRQNRIARRAQRRNERNEANKAAGLARQAEVREYALNTMREFTNEVKSDPSAAKRAKQFLGHKKNAKYKETKEYKDLENAVKTSEDPKMNKNHPYWKTPEGKAQTYFDNMMLESRAWTQSSAKKTELMAELARERLLKLNSAAAGINQKIDRLNQKRTLTKEDEKELTMLRKQRQKAEHEANAFASAWQKWKAENNIQENVTTERKRLENGVLQTTRKVKVSQPQEKTQSAIEAVEKKRTRSKVTKKKPVKQQLTDILKTETGLDVAGHERAGKEKARGEIHLKWSDLDAKQQSAIKNIEKDGLGTVEPNGGYGVVIRPMWLDKPSSDAVTFKENDLFTLTTERQPFRHGENAPRFYLFRFKKQPSEDVANILSGYGYKPTVNNIWVSPADHYASKRARESVRAIENGYEPIPF